MRVLVTGGAGFIGSHIVEGLLQAGHEAIVLDDLSHGKRENLPPGTPLYEVDVRDGAAVEAVLDKVHPQVILHQAAQVSVPYSVAYPAEDGAVNVLGTLNLLEGAQRHRVEKFVFASSVAVYGPPQYLPCDEYHPTVPLSPYGMSKWAAESYIRLFHRLYGLRYTILRYGNVYGPRQDAEGEAGVIAIFVSRMLAGEPTVIDGDGEQTRDFLYVGDVARANLLALEGGDGETLNLGTGRATSILELWRLLRRLTGYAGEERHGLPRTGDIRHMVLDAARAREVLGWEAETTLEEGLRRTIAAWQR